MIELKINAKRHRFELGLSTPEFEELKMRAKSRGFSSVSQLLRFMALKNDIVIESKILETNKIIKEILDILKEKKI